MNYALEFHDSEVIGWSQIGADLALFIVGYVHASEGKPTKDPGTGNIQPVYFLFNQGIADGEVEDWPADIGQGCLTVSGVKFDDILPLPFEAEGDVILELSLIARGEQLRFTSTALTVQGLPPIHYVEYSPWWKKPGTDEA